MSSLTTFQGRRCTKVRRAAQNSPVNNGGASSSTIVSTTSTSSSTSTTSSTSQSTTSVSSSSKPVFAPTTNFPGQGGGNQIATVNIPQVLPLPDPTPTPKPARPPPQDPPPQQQPPPPQQQPPPPPPPSRPPPQDPPPQQPPPPSQAPPPPAQVTPPPDQPQNVPPPPAQAAPQPADQPQPANNPPPNNPQNNPPANQPNAQAGTGGGTGAGAFSIGAGTGGEPGSGVVVSLPEGVNGPSLVPIAQLGPSDGSGASSGTGPANTDAAAPQPIFNSPGTAQPTASPTGSILSAGRGTGTGRNMPSTLKGSSPTGGAGIGGGSGSAEEMVATKSKSTPIIAGVVSGIIAIAVICGILFFCARRRKRQPRDIMASAQSSTRNFFAQRRTRRDEPEPTRSTTPGIERGFGQAQYMQEVESLPRPRSSSEPANRAFGAAPTRLSGHSVRNSVRDAMLPTVGEHRRSVSSISGLAYPITSDFNNPFKDPDPSAELRIVNDDYSRQGTPASALATPNAGKPPLAPIAAAAAAGGFAAGAGAAFFKPSLNSPKPQQNVQDPFRDPEPLINPFADPVAQVSPFIGAAMIQGHRKQDSEDSQSQYSEDSPVPYRHSGHTRSRTSTAVPLITKTAPSSSASSHRHNGSTDSGFVSAGSPGSVHSPRFGGGLGINNIFRRANSKKDPNRSLLPQVQPTSNPISANPPRLSIPRSHIPQTPGGNRMSTSSSSSSLSLSFPSSWGSPGPTRPASFATQNGLTLPHRNASRVSDPFDLDLPELLSYAANDTGYSAVTLGNREGEKTTERRENPGPASRRRQAS